jgi:ATP-dependent Lon protease
MAGLYFHIPFCRRICAYCDFFKSAEVGRVDSVLDAMGRELDGAVDWLADRRIRTVYFGGGTPSLCDPARLQGLADRAAALLDCSGVEEFTVEANPDDMTGEVRTILGLPLAQHDLQKGNEAPGVVTGLAWTENGGEILFIECSLSKGKGILSTTGNLGDVMKEYAVIAYQYLKSHPEALGISYKEFSEKDLHLHVPEGAIPKDGPSAGITMVSAMASAFRKKRVKSGIAMTGEITLRGKVLPVGGIKEKILAAKRAGVKTIILSSENEKDVKDIKEIYLKGLTFKYVNNISEVLEFIF